jgi:diguanylate cyclase (GGDEF)-like protein/PAS domain S-box-containing protein
MVSPYVHWLVPAALALLALALGVAAWRRRGALEQARSEGESLAVRIAALEQDVADRGAREALLRRLLESMHEALAVECDGLVYANARFAAVLGAARPAELAGARLGALVHPDYADLVTAQLELHRAGQSAPPHFEVELRDLGAGAPRVEFAVERIKLDGRPALLIAAVEMSPRPQAAGGAIDRAQGAALRALGSLSEAILTTDVEGTIVYANQAVEDLTGLRPDETLGRTLGQVLNVVDEQERRALGDPVRQALASGARVELGRRALTILRSGSEEHYVELTVSPLRNAAGVVDGTVVAVRDVSDIRGLTRQMSYQASHDALTGLVNRREFERRLQDALDVAHANGGRHVLCYLDLDRFKSVNDECGHLAGDNLLREIAGIVKEAVRDSDTVARLGGDEFGILLVGCPLEKARQIADDVVRAVGGHRFVWKDKIFNVGVSVGLVEVSRESGSLEDALSAADSACYVAKKQGSHVQVYSARDEAAARQRGEIQWLQRLQGALKDNRFELYSQPIVAVAELVRAGPGIEVLLRLRDEGGQAIPPSEFMRAAERYRLMPHVDRWVVHTALNAVGAGGVRLAPGRSVCLNLSGQTLGDPSFLEFVVDCLDRTGVAPEQLCFEVTENAVITNIEHARRFIGVLHGMGCRFALDDFGRGLSSFGNLKHLALDYLKIDGSFIRNLASDNVNQAMVTAMIKMARSLNFQVVAEQVEDPAALEAVRRMGVDFVQGYEIGRPQPLTLTLAA